MKVIVFGAHSTVGEHVVKKLHEENVSSCAVIGNENQKELLIKRGATDVVVYEKSGLETLFTGYEAVIYLTGINPGAATGKTVLVDHESVIEIVKDAQRQGVQRFVMMSAITANESAGDASRDIGAKEMPDELLRHANLTYTVVQPGALNDKPGEGKISASISLESDELEISREDLAEVLVKVLKIESTFNKTFEVAAGDTPISDALASL